MKGNQRLKTGRWWTPWDPSDQGSFAANTTHHPPQREREEAPTRAIVGLDGKGAMNKSRQIPGGGGGDRA